MNQEQRDHYAGEVEQMANRQQQLADQLWAIKTVASDTEVAEQLVHQSNKAKRLSDEIFEILND